MKVYMVTEGEYSDFGVKGIFSSREKAEAYAALYDRVYPQYRVNEVEEWEVDGESGLVPGEKWDVRMDARTGEIPRFGEPTRKACLVRPGDRGSARGPYPPDALPGDAADGEPEWRRPFFMATSHVSAEHAIKLAAEARQAWLRSATEGPTGPDR